MIGFAAFHQGSSHIAQVGVFIEEKVGICISLYQCDILEGGNTFIEEKAIS